MRKIPIYRALVGAMLCHRPFAMRVFSGADMAAPLQGDTININRNLSLCGMIKKLKTENIITQKVFELL